MMTAEESRASATDPPSIPLDSPFDADLDLATLQRVLSEMYGYDVDMDLYLKLVTNPDDWDMPTFAAKLGRPLGTINSWRNNSKKRKGADRTALPKQQGKHGQSPWWYAGTLCRWAIRHGWMRPDGTPTMPMPPGQGTKPRA